jgi:uncharacterized membrane protein (UPF0136 family)
MWTFGTGIVVCLKYGLASKITMRRRMNSIAAASLLIPATVFYETAIKKIDCRVKCPPAGLISAGSIVRIVVLARITAF